MLDTKVVSSIGQQVCCPMEHNGLSTAAPTLLEACKAAMAALSQTATFPADVEAAKRFLSAAISSTGVEQI